MTIQEKKESSMIYMVLAAVVLVPSVAVLLYLWLNPSHQVVTNLGYVCEGIVVVTVVRVLFSQKKIERAFIALGTMLGILIGTIIIGIVDKMWWMIESITNFVDGLPMWVQVPTVMAEFAIWALAVLISMSYLCGLVVLAAQIILPDKELDV